MDKYKLIRAVKPHRVLWDQSYVHFYNRELAKKAWDEVGQNMKAPGDDCKKKWRGMRDTYTRELKRAALEKKQPTWKYFRKLRFLDPKKMKRRPSSSDCSDSDTRFDSDSVGSEKSKDEKDPKIEPTLEEKDGIDATPDTTASFKYVPDEETDEKKFHKEEDLGTDEIPEDKFKSEIYSNGNSHLNHFAEQCVMDADFHFLMSVLPTLRSIPQKRKNHVRGKILDILCEEEKLLQENS